jgi:hypothetical protein
MAGPLEGGVHLAHVDRRSFLAEDRNAGVRAQVQYLHAGTTFRELSADSAKISRRWAALSWTLK